MVNVFLELTSTEAVALSQFVKRIGVEDIRPFAKGEDELWEAWHGVLKLQSALSGAGYAPR